MHPDSEHPIALRIPVLLDPSSVLSKNSNTYEYFSEVLYTCQDGTIGDMVRAIKEDINIREATASLNCNIRVAVYQVRPAYGHPDCMHSSMTMYS